MREDKRSPEVQANMLARMLRAHGRRVGAADPEGLVGLAELAKTLERVTGNAVAALKSQGFSWSEIGRALQISKQAAQERWGRFRKRSCGGCTLHITDTFGTIDDVDYCMPCFGRVVLERQE